MRGDWQNKNRCFICMHLNIFSSLLNRSAHLTMCSKIISILGLNRVNVSLDPHLKNCAGPIKLIVHTNTKGISHLAPRKLFKEF